MIGQRFSQKKKQSQYTNNTTDNQRHHSLVVIISINYRMSPEWLSFIQQEMSKDYMVKLKAFIDSERQTKVVYPDSSLTFNSMALCPYERLKVVIIGDAPFTQDLNDGLAFSAKGIHTPEENKNIIYEAYKDHFKAFHKAENARQKLFPTNQLIEWAKQGVLLINSVYTCTNTDRNAHKNKGWETFNEALIYHLNDYNHPLVFIQKCQTSYISFINPRKHLVISGDDDKWCTKANDFIAKRDVPVTLQHLQLKINWMTKNLD
jgi:uracil-DNA glycosylase